jgi:hypothetical protein
MRHRDDEPEHDGDVGPAWLVAAGPVAAFAVALTLLVRLVLAGDLAELEPGRLLATRAAP